MLPGLDLGSTARARVSRAFQRQLANDYVLARERELRARGLESRQLPDVRGALRVTTPGGEGYGALHGHPICFSKSSHVSAAAIEGWPALSEAEKEEATQGDPAAHFVARAPVKGSTDSLQLEVRRECSKAVQKFLQVQLDGVDALA